MLSRSQSVAGRGADLGPRPPRGGVMPARTRRMRQKLMKCVKPHLRVRASARPPRHGGPPMSTCEPYTASDLSAFSSHHHTDSTGKVRIEVDMIDPLVLSSSATIEALTKFGRRWGTPRRKLRKTLQDRMGKAPSDIEATFRALITECDLNAFETRRASRWWGRAYYMLGLPAGVLATVAGAAGLASTAGRVPGAVIALVAAGLTTAATFLNSDRNQRRNIVISAAWSELADDARLHNLSFAQAIEELADKSKTAPVVNDYWGRILKLHRRKGNLLRGEITTPEEFS